MPPPLAGPAGAAPPAGGPTGLPPDAVPSGDAGSAPGPDQGQGMLPPSGAPTPQDVGPQGREALGMQVMRVIVGALHNARTLFGASSKYLKPIDQAFNSLSRHFNPDPDAMKGGQVPPVSQIAQPQGPGGPPPGGGPPLGGMGGAAGGPPSPPRGPIGMRPGGAG
jgi:hypothetical protein